MFGGWKVACAKKWKETMMKKLLLAVGMIALSALVADAALLLHYDFNAPPNSTTGTNVVDNSGNGRTGTFVVNGGTRQMGSTAGVSGQAGDYSSGNFAVAPVSAINTPAINLSTLASFTISGWFNGNINATGQRIINGAAGDGIYLFAVDPYDFRYQAGSAILDTTGNKFDQVSEWTFFAATYDSAWKEQLNADEACSCFAFSGLRKNAGAPGGCVEAFP
jgi:hypothetical protein